MYQQGFVYLHKVGTAEAFSWRNVAAVNRSVTTYLPGGTFYIYSIQRKDGCRLILPEAIRDIRRLGDAIVQAVANAQLSSASAALNEGQVLRFGNLSIDLHEIGKGQKRLRWDQVEKIYVSNGSVTVYKKGGLLPWTQQDVGKIPNFPVFWAHAKSLAARDK